MTPVSAFVDEHVYKFVLHKIILLQRKHTHSLRLTLIGFRLGVIVPHARLCNDLLYKE